jgi:pimeloyl-ACP methyl ester carboxylesterase
MKNTLTIFLLLSVLCPFLTKAQGTWTSYSTQLPTKDYLGHKFKFSASVKTDELDHKAGAHLWVRGDKSAGGSTFSKDMNNNPITSKEWKTYSIEGVIDSNTAKMAFGLTVFYNGLFYFDDMKLEIDTSENTWETVYNNDFEQESLSLKEGIQSPLNQAQNANFTAGLEKKETNQYLKIEGGNVIDFGRNEATGKYADVNGVRLYYEIYGEGQPLIVLHDYSTLIASQAAYYPELMKKYRLILVDMRGQNFTIRLNQTDTLTYAAIAADVNQLMEQLKIDSANLWGIVCGARVGLLMAKDYPKRVKKLLTYGLFIQNDSTAVDPAMFKRYEDRAKQITDIQEKKLLAFLLQKDAYTISNSELSAIKTPVMLVGGDRGFVKKEHTINISKMLPNAQAHVLPGGGNNIVNIKNDAFLSIMESFFSN